MNAAQLSDRILALIDDYIRTGYGATIKMGLFTGSPSLSNLTVLADLTALAPVFTGYALDSLTLGAVTRDSLGNYKQRYTPGVFQPTADPATPQVVTGYFIQYTDTGTDYLIASEYLPAPYTFSSTLDSLALTYEGQVPNALVYGGLCASC